MSFIASKNAKHVHAILGRLGDKGVNNVIGVMPIPQQILSTEQHLRTGTGQSLPDAAQPLPGIFPKKTDTGIETSPRPRLLQTTIRPGRVCRRLEACLRCGGGVARRDWCASRRTNSVMARGFFMIANVCLYGMRARQRLWPRQSRRRHRPPVVAPPGLRRG